MVTPPQFFNIGVSSFRARTDLHLFQSLCFLEDTIANVLRRWNFRELFPLLNFYKLETCVMSQDSARVKALSMNLIQIGPALVNSIWKVLMASFCLVLRYLQRKICQRSESSNTKKQAIQKIILGIVSYMAVTLIIIIPGFSKSVKYFRIGSHYVEHTNIF